MERSLRTNSDSVNQGEFEEDENDSDLEGRLYAEIYFSNEIHETGENFEDNCMKTIQDIKNANKSSIASTSEKKATQISENVKNSSTSVGETNVRNEEQFSQGLDKNLNLEKQKNLDVEFDNAPGRVSNEISNNHLNLQQKTPKSPKNKSEIMNKESENDSSILRSVQKQNNSKNTYESPIRVNNSLTTPKSAKRKSKIDKDCENNSKRRSLESNVSAGVKSSDIQLNPICLNSRKSTTSVNHFPSISDAALDILFPDGWKEIKEIETVEKSKAKKKKNPKSNKISSKTNTDDKPNKQLIQETEKNVIIEIISSDSSEDDLNCFIKKTLKPAKQKDKNSKQLPIWLNISSDSDESILEVPIPRKPTPPLVSVQDTDTNSSESDDGIYDMNSTHSKKKFQHTSDDSGESLEENTRNNSKESFQEDTKVTSIEKSVVDSVKSCKENSRSRLLSELSNPATEDSNSSSSEKNVSNNSSETSLEISEIISTGNYENNSSYSDIPEYEKVDDSIEENVILNFNVVQKSVSSLQDMKRIRKSAALTEIETNTEYNEYVEPLNDTQDDNPRPGTSKVNEKNTRNKNKKHKTSKEKTDVEYFFEPMPKKVKDFYDNSWGGENFSIEEIQNKMSKNPKQWAILDEDWNSGSLRRQRYFLNKTKCTSCRQMGHIRANCPEPKKSPVCHMCGSHGHYETRCPHKICLTCGKKQNSFRKTCESCNRISCSLCCSRGHRKEFCPDLWRQYHHTTNESEHKLPKNLDEIMKPSDLLICCNCTMRGHDFFNCKKYRWTPHYPTPSHVQNYVSDQRSPGNSKSSTEIINLVEHSESSQTLNMVSQSKNVIEKKNPQIVECANTTVKNSRSSDVKVIFQCKLKKRPKIRMSPEQFDRKHKEQIILTEFKKAKVKELIAGRTSLDFLKCLSKNLRCDFRITVAGGSKVEMNITYYVLFSQRYVFKKLILYWSRIDDQEKRISIMQEIPNAKTEVINFFQKKLDELNKETKTIEECYNYLKETSMWLKQNKNRSNRSEINKKKKDMVLTRNLLVTLLYKHDCGVEKKAFFNLQEKLSSLNDFELIPHNTYIWLYYYYQLIFARYTPPDLVQMVNKYFALNPLNGKKINTSLNELVFNDNQDYVEECIDQKIVNEIQDKFPSFLENNTTILPQSRKEQRNVFPSTAENVISISSNDSNPIIRIDNQQNAKHFRNNVQDISEEKRKIFPSTAQDFIPISSNNYIQINHMEKQQSSRHFERSPRHDSKKVNTNFPEKNSKLKISATNFMNKALEINVPHITKAAIKIGDMINQSTLQRKHVNYLKHLIRRHGKNTKK